MSRFKKFIFSITDYDLYHIIKIFGIKITFKKKPRKENKPTKSNIDIIVWWIPIKNLRNAIRNIYYEYKNSFNENKLRQEFLNSRIQEIENHIYEYKNNLNYFVNRFNEINTFIYAPYIAKCINYNKLNFKLSIYEFFNSIVMYSHIATKNSDSYCLQFLFRNFLWFNDFYPKLNSLIIHGLGIWYQNARNIEIAIENNIPLFIEEDGFIRSIYTWTSNNIPQKYRNSISFTFSNLPHFFADEITTLEYMLNNEKLKLDNKQIERAKYLIDKIIKNKISKYNHQPIYKPEIGKNKNKVLVIDQSYGDMSISYGWANEDTFKNMLEVAIKENYNADIIIKTHPDALVKNSERAKCYYSNEDIKENVYLMAEEINPISLLEIVDKVYVCTSQLGFEALMMGKEVHVFGMPFYAGYGLTIDYQKCERRTNRRTLEEIFYITYINYSYYVNPEKEERCEIEDAIDYLIKLRREYFLEFNIRCDDKNIVDLP